MPEESPHTGKKLSWRFPRMFWNANVVELFERAAYYGMFIALVLYLTRKIGFNDVQAGDLAACFSSILYLLPTFLGLMADKIGFRRALILAFALLTAGYTLLGAASFEQVQVVSPKIITVVALALVMIGGAIVKPVISGTVAQCSDEINRVRAFSIFYWIVNIGAFLGKTVAKPLRTGFDMPGIGHLSFGLEYINFYAALMALLALAYVVVFYRNVDTAGTTKTLREVWQGFLKVLSNFRFMALILIVAGFWAIQGQLYATMTKYVLRLMGEGAKPEWLANINPAVVVLLVVAITHLIRKWKAENAIGVGLLIISSSAFVISLGTPLQRVVGNSVSVIGLFHAHPITLMFGIGIGMFGLAECFLSPKFLEYASKQAPRGEEGLYMGYQHLTTFFAWALGFALSGRLLNAFCPDPNTLSPPDHEMWEKALATGSELPAAYAHANYIWYVFTGIGVMALVGLVVFKIVTAGIDQKRVTA